MEYLPLGHFSMLLQELDETPVRSALYLKADDLHPLALTEKFFHAETEVVVFGPGVLVYEYVGVARDSDNAGALDVVFLEEQGSEMAHHRVGQDDLLLAVDFVYPVGGQTGQIDETEIGLLALFQQYSHVILAVVQEGHRMLGVDYAGRQQVPGLGEEFPGHALIHLGDAPEVHELYIRGLQILHELLVKSLFCDLLLLDLADDLLELGLGVPARLRIRIVGEQDAPVEQSAHADHEELVQVALIDSQEFEPFKEGNGGVPRFHQDPEIELEPAQLPVHEACWTDRGRISLFGGRLLCDFKLLFVRQSDLFGQIFLKDVVRIVHGMISRPFL